MSHVNPIQVQKYLRGVDYPASKAALLEKARSLGADKDVCASLEQLPDEQYQTPADVSQAFGALPDAVVHKPTGAERGSNEFLLQAIQDSMAEIQICELALEKLEDAGAKAFAQSMIDEHGAMGRELERMAAARGLDLPRRMRPEQDMTADELAALAGRDFAQRWIQYNIDVHERDIKVFQHYCGEDYDADIRRLARSSAETFARHLRKAHEVGRELAKA
jgi:predicted outer membrane protein